MTDTATIERVFPARIVKSDDEQRIAVGVVLEPRGPDDPDYVLGTGEAAQLVKAGSWVMAMHYPDEAIWDRVKKGELASFSVAGSGVRITETT